MIAYGIMYSFSVFFKPIAAHFHWGRSTVSSIFSLSLIFRGVISIGIGWLADRYGPVKVSVLCGFIVGLGLILTSRVTELWQFYITYGVFVATGLSGAFSIGSAVTARWFSKRRGLALGIVATGSGLGTMILVPFAEHLIGIFNWSVVFVIFGIGGMVILMGTAFLLKPAPKGGENLDFAVRKHVKRDESGTTLKAAAFSKELMVLIIIYLSFGFCVQMIMIHLVNYATDMGLTALHAAGFISLIGFISIAGRLLMGSASDRIGPDNSLIICSALLLVSLIWLLFDRSSAKFYVFSVLFGFAYGGQIPLIPMFIIRIFGTRIMATLIGLLMFIGALGGGLGSWVGGKVYDATQNYQLAFTIAAVTSLIILMGAMSYKKSGTFKFREL